MDVILRNEIVERAKAGDKCIITGCLIVVPDVGQLSMPGSFGSRAEAQRERGPGRAHEGFEGITGLNALGARSMNYKLAFMACMVQDARLRVELPSAQFPLVDGLFLHVTGTTNPRGTDDDVDEDPETMANRFSTEEIEDLQRMIDDPQLYSKLVSSIAPSVHGHDEVKRGILLQLMGGVHKRTTEGINLRGDINVCVVGDPSTSKSQFL
ncbi:MAG: LOW QUALITY PROTEIN: MCM2/3/5 family-domain-containing protein, partial [Olpidium bornovanus]